MNDEAARQGRPDDDHLTFSISAAAAFPDPALYRQELPVGIRRAYEWGEIDGAEVWRRLARLWGAAEVVRLTRRPAA